MFRVTVLRDPEELWKLPVLGDIRIGSGMHPVARTGGVRASGGAYGRDIFKLVGIQTSRNNCLHIYIYECVNIVVPKCGQRKL